MERVEVIPRPGSELGPCREACMHIECKRAKNMANSNCRLCGRQLGYESQFCSDPATLGVIQSQVHSQCLADLRGQSRRAALEYVLENCSELVAVMASRIESGVGAAAGLVSANSGAA